MQRVTLLVFVLLVIVALSGCGRQQAGKPSAPADAEKPQQEAIAVKVQLVAPVDLAEEIEVTGTLQPADQVSVGTRTSGRIVWIIGKEGVAVNRGDVVARIDDTDAKTQVRAAKTLVQAAEARLEQAKAAVLQQKTSTDSGILTAQAALEAAKARLIQARVTAEAQDATTSAQIKAAQAALDSAKSRLDMVRNGARTQERKVAENAVQLAEATYNNDKANYERYSDLYNQKAIAKSILDGAETKMQISKAQLDSAKQQLSLVQEGARAEDIQAAEAAVRQAEENLAVTRAGVKQVEVAHANVDIAETGVKQARAALESARASKQVDVMRDKDVLAAQAALQQARETVTTALQNLDYTQVYSPVSGVVSEKMVNVGESVGSNEAVLHISTNQSLYFEASVSELAATRLRSGQRVKLTVDALQGDRGNFYSGDAGNTIYGSVEKVVPVVDARTRNFTVRIVVPRTEALFPGMFARGAIVVTQHQNTVAVPKDVLVDRAGKQVLFVAQDGKASLRTVTLGAVNGAMIQVLSGLAVGEQIITVGQQTLLDGDAISVIGTP